MKDGFTLGRLLGQTEALTFVAGGCTAAQAAKMKEIRDTKAYLSHAKTWGEFCRKYFHTSKGNATKFIQLLEEFGPAYFKVAQLTRISADTFRALAPSIREEALHHNGQAIALLPENAEKVAAAVDELRKTITVKPQPAAAAAAPLEKRCIALVLEIEATSHIEERRDEVWRAIRYLREQLGKVALAM
jgi:hypothetical protein